MTSSAIRRALRPDETGPSVDRRPHAQRDAASRSWKTGWSGTTSR